MRTCNALWCAGILGAMGGEAMAAPSPTFEGEVDYAVPVTAPELKPYARFFVPRFRVFTDDDGKFHILLPVPRDLAAGQAIVVELVENQREGTRIRFDRDLGSAQCEVPNDWATSRCTYTFNDAFREKVPVEDARKYLEKKYAGDASLLTRERVVLGEFLESTESVGVADFRSFSAACAACLVGNGTWDSSYVTRSGQTVQAELSLERTQGHYFNSTGSGQIKNISYSGPTASGVWSYGTSSGWFRFVFDGEGHFNGAWGLGAAGSPAVGSWTGMRRDDFPSQ